MYTVCADTYLKSTHAKDIFGVFMYPRVAFLVRSETVSIYFTGTWPFRMPLEFYERHNQCSTTRQNICWFKEQYVY